MVVPLSIVAVGVVVAAVLGFFAGWFVASSRASNIPAEPDPEPSRDERPPVVIESGLEEIWSRLPAPRTVTYVRLDAADTWRRTHGQRAVEAFASQIAQFVRERLPADSGSETTGHEIVAIYAGDAEIACDLVDELRAHTFLHDDGAQALVTATIGLSVDDHATDSLQDVSQKAFAAMAEAGRRRRGTLAEWTASGVRHLRPVDAAT